MSEDLFLLVKNVLSLFKGQEEGIDWKINLTTNSCHEN